MRKFLLGAALALFAFALVACGGNGDDGGGAEATPTPTPAAAATPSPTPAATPETRPAEVPAERTTIRFAAQPDATNGTRALIDAFNDSQDEFYAEWVELTNDSGEHRNILLNSFRAGSTEYDVVSLDVVWAGEFAAAGFIEPLDQRMAGAGLNARMFNSGSMASGMYQGQNFVLPFFPDLGFLYFRSDIVSAETAARLVAGNYTWADLYDWANEYMGEEGTQYGIVYQSGLYEGLTCNLNEFTHNWTDIRGGLQMMRQFTDSDATPANILVFTEGETHNAFINGQSVFARNWPYQWGMIMSEGSIDQAQVSVAPLPGGGTVGGWLLAMNASSANPEGAWALMQFMATNEGQRVLSINGGYLPGFNDTLGDAEVIANNALLTMEGFQNALLTTIARPVAANYAEVSERIQIAAHGFLAGSLDLDAAVAEIEAALR